MAVGLTTNERVGTEVRVRVVMGMAGRYGVCRMC